MKKKALGAFAMSCALAAGMSIPAFAAGTEVTAATSTQSPVPVKTQLTKEAVTLKAEVPTAIPFTIKGITAGKVCGDAILPKKGELQIVNKSSVPLKLTGVQVASGADNTINGNEYAVWKMKNLTSYGDGSDLSALTEDYLTFCLGIYNDKGEGFGPYAQPMFTQETFPGSVDAYWTTFDPNQKENYSNFPTPFPTSVGSSFTVDVDHAYAYVTSEEKVTEKVLGLGQEKNYFNIVFTLSI